MENLIFGKDFNLEKNKSKFIFYFFFILDFKKMNKNKTELKDKALTGITSVKIQKIQRKIFLISKVKRTFKNKSKETQNNFTTSDPFITPRNKTKAFKKEKVKVNSKENLPSEKTLPNEEYEENEKSENVLCPNSLISISKDVYELLKEKGIINTKYLNERIFSKIKNTENISEKNIQRRIYDAINVMNAIGLIVKDKGNLSFQGERGFVENFCGKRNKNERISEELYKKEISINQKLQEIFVLHTKVKIKPFTIFYFENLGFFCKNFQNEFFTLFNFFKKI